MKQESGTNNFLKYILKNTMKRFNRTRLNRKLAPFNAARSGETCTKQEMRVEPATKHQQLHDPEDTRGEKGEQEYSTM